MDLKALSQILGTFMPIMRLDDKNHYLLGTKVMQLQMRGNQCMVTVGGGFVTIQEYYDKYCISQCLNLHRMMVSQGQTFQSMIVKLINLKNRDKKFKEVDQVLATYAEQDAEQWENTN